jgi:hypothetical protein
VVAILLYLGWEVSKIVSPPSLKLFEPPENYITGESLISIVGSTDPEAQVIINGDEIFVDKDGSFSETLVLESGINTIIVEAKKPRSRPITINRQVLFEDINNNIEQ